MGLRCTAIFPALLLQMQQNSGEIFAISLILTLYFALEHTPHSMGSVGERDVRGERVGEHELEEAEEDECEVTGLLARSRVSRSSCWVVFRASLSAARA